MTFVISIHRRSTHTTTIPLILASALLVLAIATPRAQSASYRTCGLSSSEQQPTSGHPTYNLSLKRIGTTCTTARRVAKAFHACRSTTGYTCSKKVLRTWTCRGKKDSSTPTLFYATVTCSWGARRVKNSYQQNTPSG